jgi:hypothetical protein
MSRFEPGIVRIRGKNARGYCDIRFEPRILAFTSMECRKAKQLGQTVTRLRFEPDSAHKNGSETHDNAQYVLQYRFPLFSREIIA